MNTANIHKSHAMLLQMLPCYIMLFILFIADSMGVRESLGGEAFAEPLPGYKI